MFSTRFFIGQLFHQQRHFQQQQLPRTLTRGFSNYIEPRLKDNHVSTTTTTQTSEAHLLTCYRDLYSNYHNLEHSHSVVTNQLSTQQKLTTLYGMSTIGLVGCVLYQSEHINKYHDQNETESAHFKHFMDDLSQAINTTYYTLTPTTHTDLNIHRRYQLESQREALNKMLIDLTTKFDKSFANRQTFELFTTVLKNTIKLCDEGIGALKFQETLHRSSTRGNNNNNNNNSGISSSSIPTSPSTTATSMLTTQHPDYFYNLMRLYNQQQYPEHDYYALPQTSPPSSQFQQFHHNHQHPSFPQSPPHTSHHHQQSQQQTTNIA